MTKSVRVVPAVLTDDPRTLEMMLRQAETFTDYVQIDITDGQFVPSRSINWEHLFRLKTTLNWEAHLMVVHPEDYLSSFKEAGAKKIFFHYEATSSPLKIVAQARNLGLKVGIAINPDTPISSILPLTDEIDSVLFMTVHPGFYGGKFLPEVMDKIMAFRRAQPKMEIGIDGGIKESNIIQVARTGANFVCVGSAIFLQPDPAVSFRQLQAMVQQS